MLSTIVVLATVNCVSVIELALVAKTTIVEGMT